jgi:hypothetical protein
MPANLPFPLESGTILHFRSFGLKFNNYTPPPSQRYWRIDKELGRGNLPVYRATPLGLESETESDVAESDLEVDLEEELSEGQSVSRPRPKEALDDFGKRIQAESDLDFGKRKRTETSESEKAAELLAITKAPTTVHNARGRFTKKAKGKSSSIVRVPTVSEASDKTVKASTVTATETLGNTVVETPVNTVVETPINTANPLPFVEALSIAADGPKTASTSAGIEVKPTRPSFFKSRGDARAIKVKYLKAETYHHSQGLGQLGEEFDKGLSLAAVAESVVSPMMAGWVQVSARSDGMPGKRKSTSNATHLPVHFIA